MKLGHSAIGGQMHSIGFTELAHVNRVTRWASDSFPSSPWLQPPTACATTQHSFQKLEDLWTCGVSGLFQHRQSHWNQELDGTELCKISFGGPRFSPIINIQECVDPLFIWFITLAVRCNTFCNHKQKRCKFKKESSAIFQFHAPKSFDGSHVVLSVQTSEFIKVHFGDKCVCPSKDSQH